MMNFFLKSILKHFVFKTIVSFQHFFLEKKMEFQTSTSNSPSVLQLIKKNVPPDFTIINNENKYECHFNVLSLSSKTISQLRNDKSHISSLNIKSKVTYTYLKDVINFFYGEQIVLTFNNIHEINLLAGYLNADYLKGITSKALFFFDYAKNILFKFKDNDEFNDNDIDFLASFFHVFAENKMFIQFPISYIKRVINSQCLRILDEDYLIHWIIFTYPDKDNKSLLESVNFQNVSSNGFRDIFSSRYITNDILDKIKKEFIKMPEKRKINTINHKRYLTDQNELTRQILSFQHLHNMHLSSVDTVNITPSQ